MLLLETCCLSEGSSPVRQETLLLMLRIQKLVCILVTGFGTPNRLVALESVKKEDSRSHLGRARTIHVRCIYGILGREFIKYTVIYGVYIRFWPTLDICSIALLQ